MELVELLRARKGAILARCFDLTAGTYPDETASFLKSEADPFANPVGRALREALEGLLRALIEGGTSADFRQALEEFLRIRAVQTPRASEALAFMGFLRRAIRDEVEAEAARIGGADRLRAAYLGMEDRIGEAVLVACDLYVESRRRIDEVRINEVKAREERLSRMLLAVQGQSGEKSHG
jgi:hypothetical protein